MENEFGRIAGLIGDPVRAKILWALLDGRAYTATELAVYADTSAPNMSMHLSKLVNAELLAVEVQGRHRYYNYARQDIAYAIEALAGLIPEKDLTHPGRHQVKPVEYCRTCYDHLAGTVGVLITESLVGLDLLHKGKTEYEVTSKGMEWFFDLNIDVESLRQQKRSFARCCLDWSERRHHLAGALGAALCERMVAQGWVRKISGTRAMSLTTKGKQALYERLRLMV